MAQAFLELLVLVKDQLLGLLCRDEVLQIAQNVGHRGLIFGKHRLQLGQPFARIVVLGRRQTQNFTAAQEAVDDVAKGVGILAQQERRFRVHAFGGQEFVCASAQTLGQHHQLAGR